MGDKNTSQDILYDAVILKEAKTKEDVITELSNHLLKKGYVNKDYCAATLDREDNYPTGLSTKPIGIAVPHSNPDNVLTEAVIVAVSENLVKFNEMGNNTSLVDVGIIFLLALKGENNHLNYLKNIINYFKQSNNVNFFYKLRPEKQIKNIFLKDVLQIQ
ncbi:PTS sugar transporter subunit IIA [Pectinatus sottacetonis]|uniref:PTS sugar transporter subunit IIA n=1 Tax=Pectinatus sottacetonis TaxID=1002795 RepID=UPI0018C7344D|nr:PTS sugar transporter subunit IIA [Pectinatus sottacetonis]